MSELKSQYFEWLCEKVLDTDSDIRYCKLMVHLHDFTFVSLMKMDENRERDGLDLRYRFGLETDTPRSIIHQEFNDPEDDDASVLEVMVALAMRCEESIMTDDECGDRTGTWFWNMIVSLGIGPMNDSRFDGKYVNVVLEKFVNRQYRRNGEGGLFTIDGLKRDMRKVEIWYQMCWYLDYL